MAERKLRRLNLQFFAEPAGDVAPVAGAEASDVTIDASKVNVGTVSADAENAENTAGKQQEGNNSVDALNAEIARLKAEMAKQKSSLDKATSEAGNLRKELRSRQTQEEIDAETKREAEEKAAKELDELRREVAKGKTVKSVMGKLGLDEEASGRLADCLYGAADADNALLEIQKAWQAREKALKLEYGKIPAPGTGADSNSPEAQAIARAAKFGKERNAQNEQALKAMNAYMR